MAQALRHLRHDPPVGARFAGRWQKGVLARDAALGVGDGAVLLAPRERRQADAAGIDRIGGADRFRHDRQFAGAQRGANGIGVGHARHRIGGHDPHRFHLAGSHRFEEIDGFQAGRAGHARCPPEATDALDIGGREIHVRRQRVGERADLAAAHGVGLAGDRKGTHARPPDTAGQQMAVEDGVDLVDAGARLVHALGIEGDGLVAGGEPLEKLREVCHRQIAIGEPCRLRGGQGGIEAFGVTRHEILGHGAARSQRGQQTIEQSDVRTRPQRQVQIGDIAALGAARVDHHDAHARSRPLGGLKPLEQHRMTPGEVAAHQHDKIGQFEILVEAGHRVAAEGALVARHRRGHAEPRVGIDVGGAEEALDQLVGDVIVLGQQLARDIEGNRVRPVTIDDVAKTGGHRTECGVPRHAPAVDLGMQQPVFQRQSLTERRALRAETSQIRRMGGIAFDAGAAPAVGRRDDTAADTAIGAGGADLFCHRASTPSKGPSLRSG